MFTFLSHDRYPMSTHISIVNVLYSSEAETVFPLTKFEQLKERFGSTMRNFMHFFKCGATVFNILRLDAST